MLSLNQFRWRTRGLPVATGDQHANDTENGNNFVDRETDVGGLLVSTGVQLPMWYSARTSCYSLSNGKLVWIGKHDKASPHRSSCAGVHKPR